MFDVMNFPSEQAACEAGHTFEPVFPGTRLGIGATITVRGPRSQAARDHAQQRLNELHERRLGERRNSGEVRQMSVQEVEANLIDMAVMYTAGWDGFTSNGAPLPFSATAARELYTAHANIRDQVISQAEDLGNFVKPLQALGARPASDTQPSSVV